MRTLLVTLLLLAPAAGAQRQAAPVTSPGQTAPHLQSVEQILAEIDWRFGDPATGAPTLAPSGAAGLPAHIHTGERCLRPLLTRVRDSVGAFTAEERAWVSARDPALALAVASGLRRGGVLEATSDLPDHPELTETLEGKECVVHYTLTGADASPDMAYVQAVVKQVDQALKKLSKAYRRPYYEPDRDGLDKLHVFLRDLDDLPGTGDALGFVQGVNSVPGSVNDKAETVYMAMHTGLRDTADEIGMPWKKLVRATAFHEAMHGVQAATNSFLSSWLIEGQATWIEQAQGKVLDSLLDYLESPESLLRSPEHPLWHDSIHQYSLAPLFAYLEFRLGKGANAELLELAPELNDGLGLLELLLIQEEFLFFDEFYGPFLARLVQKDIPGLPGKKLPDMALEGTVDSYGFEVTGSVPKTGVRAYKLDVPEGLKTDLLYTRVGNPPGEGDGDGSGAGGAGGGPGGGEGNEPRPMGILAHGKNKRLTLFPGFWDVVSGFKGKQGAVLLVTDLFVEFQTNTPTPYRAEVFAPHIVVHDVDTNSPVPFGEPATITFTYDLLGVPAGSSFPVILFQGIKGPGLKSEQNLFLNWAPGVEQTYEHTWFPPFGGKGNYGFRFTAKTPPDSFGGGHMKSKTKTKVKVLGP